MSLRVDDRARSGRSRSRSRTRDRDRDDEWDRDRDRDRDDDRDKPSRSKRASTSRRPDDSEEMSMPGSFSTEDFERAGRGKDSMRRRRDEEDSDTERGEKSRRESTRKSTRFAEEDTPAVDRLARDSEGFDTAASSASRASKRASAPLAYPDDDSFMPKYPVDFPASPMSPTAGGRDSFGGKQGARYSYTPENSAYAPPAAMPDHHGHQRSSSYSVPAAAGPGLDGTGTGYRVAKSPSELKREDKLDRTTSTKTRERGASLSVGEPKKSALRSPSPSGAFDRPSRLSVGGLGPGGPQTGAGGMGPPSPLLEAYKGTYQSISPIPSPMMLPADLSMANFHGTRDGDLLDDDMTALSLVSTATSLSSTATKTPTDKSKRRVKIYDANTDGEVINKALSHMSGARPEGLISVLPTLTHDQVLELRNAYKKTYKVAGRGINMTKHIKAATAGHFGKLAYVTSLGKWESEAYWANTWYQSHATSRELLIETLMGRSNADIREIKSAFRDKRYADDLERALDKELKPDKFRTAVLIALKARRQEETDSMPAAYRDADVEHLRAALSEDGGETAMLQIVVTRSDTHLRAVLAEFEARTGANFAREALRKSNNLVGETLAHILNGVINRAARDASLLRHAVDDVRARNRAVELRYELLMSRLVRLHWDRVHLARVKEDYVRRYGVALEREVRGLGSGGFGEFCARLCEV